MSKQFKGLWIPAEVLCDKDLKHVEKLVLSMALAMRDGIRMSDATIADQIGVSDRSIAGILKSLVSKGYMGKSGNGYHRKFTALRKVAQRLRKAAMSSKMSQKIYARLRHHYARLRR
jgi:DNA-binding MarR family transcriptional regulator